MQIGMDPWWVRFIHWASLEDLTKFMIVDSNVPLLGLLPSGVNLVFCWHELKT